MTKPFKFGINQLVRVKDTGRLANVEARAEHWDRGATYRLRFQGMRTSTMAQWPEGQLEAAAPPVAPLAPHSNSDDYAEFTVGQRHPHGSAHTDSEGGENG